MINTEIYGAPDIWTNAQYMTFAKYANFNTAANPENELQYGNTVGKTPINELVENSICTQALGTESLYSHIVYAHGDEFTVDDRDYTPYFYAECVEYANNVQNNNSYIRSNTNYNSWSPYVAPVGSFKNKSALSKPIVEYKPKKVLYLMQLTLVDEYYNTRRIYLNDIQNNPDIFNTYPYVKSATLVPFCDRSSTDAPERYAINSDALFGICPNIHMQSGVDYIDINYAAFRSMEYNAIPIYGVFGTIFAPSTGTTLIYLCPRDDIGANYRVAHPWNDDFKEYLIRQAACFGVFVRISNDSGLPTTTIPLDNNDIICGVLVNGVGHGDYTRGAANRDNDIWEWQTNRDSDYDPYNPPDPNTYSDETTFNFIGGLSSMFKRYVLNSAGVDALGQQLFKIGDDIVVDQSDSYQDYQEIILNNFLTNNPIDAIISLKKYPLANIPHVDTSEQLRLGKKQISVVGYRFPYTNFRYLFGAINVHPRFENTFLDYAPFTTLELYVPFCGTKELDAGVYMGHKLSVELQIDFTTGSCDAYIKCDNLVTDTLSGQCAIDIPVTGTESATVDSQITNGIIQGKAARGKATTDFATANFSPGGWIKSITNPFDAASNRFENKLNRAGAEYNVTHTQTPLRSVGTSTPVGGWTIDFNCRLFITYPTGSVINDSNPPSFNDVELKQYGHINGFATVEASTMANFKIQGAPSFVVADSINLDGIAATETEKDLIRAACKEGCYI